MATFKNNKDGFLITKEPALITEWEAQPLQEIQFQMPSNSNPPQIGDRIHARLDIGTRGDNAGSPVDVYYILKGGINCQPSGTRAEVTAMATRVEA